MAEAVAQATIGADLATKADIAALAATTKRDLGEMELRLTNRIDRIVRNCKRRHCYVADGERPA